MAKRLYVGNLAFDVSNDDLQEMFSAHGTVVSAEVVTDRSTRQSRGFGFVEMSTDAEAQAAIGALEGRDCNGRTLSVSEAKPRAERSNGGGGGGGRRERGGRGDRF